MEVFTIQEAKELCGADHGLVCEVTGIEEHELQFQKERGQARQ